MGSRPIVAVDARRSGGSGIGRYTQCLLEAFRLSESLRDSYDLVELVSDDSEHAVGKVLWNAPQLSPWCSGDLERILDAAGVDLLIAPQYYVPPVESVPVVRVLHDAHPYWHDYESPSRHVFERIYGAENLAVLAREVDLLSWGSSERDVASLIQRMYEIGSARATELVTVSRFSADELTGYLPATAGRWNVAYPFVPASLTASKPGRLDGAPSILAVSKLEPRKNQLALIAAVAAMRADFPDVRLTLVGGPTASFPEYANRVRRAAAEASDVVRLIESAPDDLLASMYADCDLFVSCSISEGFGFPGLEALNAGAAVLVGSGTSMPEIYGARARYFDESGFREGAGPRRFKATVADLQAAIGRAIRGRESRSGAGGEASRPEGVTSTIDSFARSLKAIVERALQR
jgi:glycosyltransferase involved in cell wall biosynthesis